MTRSLLASVLVLVAGCSGPPAEGRFPCNTARDCPAAWYCRTDRLCWSTPDPDAGPGTDAGAHDASSDAGSDGGPTFDLGLDGGAEPVTVVVQDAYSSLSPTLLSGIEVVFHDATGAVVDLQITDSAGRAVSRHGAVDAVTIVRPSGAPGGIDRLYTLFGVLPRYTISWDLGDAPSTLRQVALPAAFTGASSYFVSGGCGVATTTDWSSVPTVCDGTGSGITSITALALDGAGVSLAWSGNLGAAEADPFSLPSWQTTFGAAIPVSITGGSATSTLSSNLAFSSEAGTFVGSDLLDGRTGSVRPLPLLDTSRPYAFQVFASDTTPSGPVGGSLTVRYDGALPTSISVDLDVVPSLSAFSGDRSDPDRPVLSVTLAGGPADYTTAVFQYRSSWTVIVPGDSTQISVPALPDSMASRRPGADTPSYSISRVDALDANTYADVRSHPLGFIYSVVNFSAASGSY